MQPSMEADLFGLGCVLHIIATGGRHPFVTVDDSWCATPKAKRHRHCIAFVDGMAPCWGFSQFSFEHAYKQNNAWGFPPQDVVLRVPDTGYQEKDVWRCQQWRPILANTLRGPLAKNVQQQVFCFPAAYHRSYVTKNICCYF